MTPRATMNAKPVFTVAGRVINFDSAFRHKLLCDGPTFSTGSACAYSCSFCYVPDLMRKLRAIPSYAGIEGAHEDIVIRRSDPVRTLIHQLETAEGRRLAPQRLVCYASPLVDVAANMELVRETEEICFSLLNRTNWHIRLLSKSNLLPKIAQHLDQSELADHARERIIYGVSTGTLDDNLARAFEAGTPLVSKRLESLRWLQDNGFRTFGMLCPSLPRPAGDYFEWSESCMAAIRADKCEHVWAEVLNVRGESTVRTLQALKQGCFTEEAATVAAVMAGKGLWENYARLTFLAHVKHCPPGKLRFLQYVTAASRPWWKAREKEGAVLL